MVVGAERRIVRARIKGRVQGVWFRAWTEAEAQAHGLDGWVRNRRDGTVEALFAGTSELVADIIEACRQGPPGARVSNIDVIDVNEEPGRGFRIVATE